MYHRCLFTRKIGGNIKLTCGWELLSSVLALVTCYSRLKFLVVFLNWLSIFGFFLSVETAAGIISSSRPRLSVYPPPRVLSIHGLISYYLLLCDIFPADKRHLLLNLIISRAWERDKIFLFIAHHAKQVYIPKYSYVCWPFVKFNWKKHWTNFDYILRTLY